MTTFYIQLEARDPARNISRSYQIIAGQDLFGDWVVELTYGRIGAKGRTKAVLVADETAARHYVRQCLNKRKSAPKRIGVSYETVSVGGEWTDI
ncbi:WGR domain-containing protein [Methylococcus geothermalis]|uniref:WGR domain-containing protein n=1 Tax=Methylococcus geothermalis TaxID=2681310 RepID=A0A858Q5K8_9GAMM|nr:WGR domain-containing protein [Methylococcus geothermalis]QJD29026.1 WGR domain-containing protein [Methylococcus geothermalis]